MTTICFKDGVLATDSGMQDSGLRVGRCQKAYPMKDGSIVTACGESQKAEAFRAWIEAGGDPEKAPKLDEGFNGVHLLPDGTAVWYDGDPIGYSYEPEGGFWALGSGFKVAVGAMAAGASAEEACAIACRFDAGSSGPVQTFHLSRLADAAE